MSSTTPFEIESAFVDNAELWLDASENHAFLVGCANGTVTESQFNTWLVQDYMYVTSFHQFLSAIMKDAPVVDDEILKSGMVALNNELAWFQERARERGLDLSVSPLPTTIKYKEFMSTMAPCDYSLKMVALYLIERVYQKAWSSVLVRGGEEGLYSKFAKNWGNKEFAGYVDELEIVANRELKKSTIDAKNLQALFKEIMTLEVMFWDMAFEGV
jgi:formylaminopyrimidine deformylase / aminopyrimidine aminohydrolase